VEAVAKECAVVCARLQSCFVLVVASRPSRGALFVNAVVAPIHPKATPVILTQPAEIDRWLEADTSDALTLQRRLPDNALRIVANGEGEDGAAA
jgi:hypothetical protein